MSDDRPLAGVRILDLTWVGAGPFCTKVLADFGAEVVKVESARRPDQLRKAEPLVGSRSIEESGYFANRNAGKLSVSVDLKHPQARGVVLAMAARSDVVINSFSFGVMERLGLEYEDMKSARPDIICLSMPLAGRDGPYRDFVGYGMNIAALVGLMAMGALPARWPVGTGTNFPDHLPNPLHAAFAILAALAYRRRTGLGQEIVLSQIESTLAPFADDILEWGANGNVPSGAHDDPQAAPHGLFPCRGEDRWIALSVTGNAAFERFSRVIERPELATDPRFADHPIRRARAAELDAIVSQWSRRHEPRAAVELLQAAGIAAGVVQNAADLVDHDPHLAARGFWQRLDHPVMGKTLYHGVPARIEGIDSGYRSSAPLLGQHNDELPRLSGLSRERIAALKNEGGLR
ncbi:CaiB/BaiF CoA transferase family protein [Neoaquamicrobium sediminum]|uniref:CoA transferase n=1 Tax=Neoaquamicrobium sediminum TaxID=1849104 RepID=A0ABV3WV18_9HYPH